MIYIACICVSHFNFQGGHWSRTEAKVMGLNEHQNKARCQPAQNQEKLRITSLLWLQCWLCRDSLKKAFILFSTLTETWWYWNDHRIVAYVSPDVHCQLYDDNGCGIGDKIGSWRREWVGKNPSSSKFLRVVLFLFLLLVCDANSWWQGNLDYICWKQMSALI